MKIAIFAGRISNLAGTGCNFVFCREKLQSGSLMKRIIFFNDKTFNLTNWNRYTRREKKRERINEHLIELGHDISVSKWYMGSEGSAGIHIIHIILTTTQHTHTHTLSLSPFLFSCTDFSWSVFKLYKYNLETASMMLRNGILVPVEIKIAICAATI